MTLMEYRPKSIRNLLDLSEQEKYFKIFLAFILYLSFGWIRRCGVYLHTKEMQELTQKGTYDFFARKHCILNFVHCLAFLSALFKELFCTPRDKNVSLWSGTCMWPVSFIPPSSC